MHRFSTTTISGDLYAADTKVENLVEHGENKNEDVPRKTISAIYLPLESQLGQKYLANQDDLRTRVQLKAVLRRQIAWL